MSDEETRWYKDAIIYQLHIKAFFDSNNDGTGDFSGLTKKLDYITDLGVTAIWVLPFYPSPLRDDGYDIADYKAINSRYGTMADFRRFLREAHKRGLKVITELVINHTSDQHPWFQRARNSPAGSKWRDYYVWSDTDQKYQETRIIFTDTETSNWTWDPVAKAYYWHRFFSHQPDLNFDNPKVLEGVLNVMKFWLDMGVDGLRLDAIPYLCEREGTNNENLPETHDILKRMRRWLDENYSNRLLLGEANQWPEDVLPYFGDEAEPECHMAFHFPLMPRMYMALAQEDRHPVTDIMAQTPEIPVGSQWAVFLRNHDELTLEMVTDRERDYLWNFYASDPRMRVNVGIRRRLAPLLDNDRNKIQLLNSMLMSMPGTPIVYYGDEIGMGDNIFLGDRDSVRTPMQWTPDRNGGFSAADPARLYLPAIMDPIYGYEALNVESQRRNASSYLNWMKRLVAVRKSQIAFGRGTLRFFFPGNRKVLAYTREYQGDIVLCVTNLSRSAQPAELDLSEYRGRVPVELLGDSPFPPIGDLPYFLTLPPHGFYWFKLEAEAEVPQWHAEPALVLPELYTLVLPKQLHSLLQGHPKSNLETRVLPQFLLNQRWFSGKEAGIAKVKLDQWETLNEKGADWLPATFTVELGDGSSQQYFLPLSLRWEEQEEEIRQFISAVLARVRKINEPGFLVDAMGDERGVRQLFAHFIDAAKGDRVDYGPARFSVTSAFPRGLELESLQLEFNKNEQSNTSVRVGKEMILKAYRRVQSGVHPELEIGRFLTDVAHYPNAAPLLGTLEIHADSDQPTALAILQGYIHNQGDGWSYTLEYLSRYLDDRRFEDQDGRAEEADHTAFMELMHTLGRRIAELHHAFATPTEDPAFQAEKIESKDLEHWHRSIWEYVTEAKASLEKLAGREDLITENIDKLRAQWPRLEQTLKDLMPKSLTALKTRTHGDLHLGQVLVAENDFFLVDFEGEPLRPISERRAKHIPLRDLSGMLRSLDYAAHMATYTHNQRYSGETSELAYKLTREWHQMAHQSVLDGYQEGIQGCPSAPEHHSEFNRLAAIFNLEKACYELVYETNNRPRWSDVPIAGLIDWIDNFKEPTDHG